MPITIPEQLRKDDFRFILLRPREKRPFELDWVGVNNYKYDDPKLINHISNDGNYGVVAGGNANLIIIDADTDEVAKAVEDRLLPTFTCKTGRPGGGGRHYYYLADRPLTDEDNIRLTDGGKASLGDVQAWHKQIVGPGSIHPTGGIYEVINPSDIAPVAYSEIKATLDRFTKPRNQSTVVTEPVEVLAFTEQYLKMSDVVTLANLKKTAEGWQGPHPVHGSEGGTNLTINESENVWHCHRCGSGGTPLQFLAVTMGVLQCEDCKGTGFLVGENFKKVREEAIRKYGKTVMPSLQPKPALAPNGSVTDGMPKPNQWSPTVYGMAIMQKYNFVTFSDNKQIRVYSVGAYIPGGEIVIEREAQTLLGYDVRIQKIREITSYISKQTYIDRKQWENTTPPKLIPLKNGVFDIMEMKFLPHSADYHFTTKIPVEYNPDAKCPLIDKFLSEVTANEKDAKTLVEFLAYCLYRAMPISRSIILTGSGANGKSTWLNTMTEFLGEENVAHTELIELEKDKFAKADLHGKLANLCSEISSAALKGTGVFKKLTGGVDKIRGEMKFKDNFFFSSYAKLMFACNRMPNTYDNSEAFFRRWIPMEFPRKFPENSPACDRSLPQKLVQPNELSGLLNRCIQILPEVLQRGFTSAPTAEEAEIQWIAKANPSLAFLKAEVREGTDCFIITSELWEKFQEYCKHFGHELPKQRLFINSLKEYLPKAYRVKVGKSDERRWAYENIRWATADDIKEAEGDPEATPMQRTLDNHLCPDCGAILVGMVDNQGKAQEHCPNDSCGWSSWLNEPSTVSETIVEVDVKEVVTDEEQ